MDKMRIQKYLSQIGAMSRREAEAAIRAGRVRVNGKGIPETGMLIDPDKDKVEVLPGEGAGGANGKTEKKITVAVYKPRGVVCSENSAEGETVFEVFPQFKDLNIVGRLDKESEGLLLMSNDGVVTSAVTGSEHAVPKEYVVTVREKILPSHIRRMEEGIMLDGQKTLPAEAKILGDHKFSLIIREGRNHQIRRMTDFFHLTVERLVRVRIGGITLKGLNPGGSRVLTTEEVASLKRLKFGG
jgi:pseudouridine synthase